MREERKREKDKSGKECKGVWKEQEGFLFPPSSLLLSRSISATQAFAEVIGELWTKGFGAVVPLHLKSEIGRYVLSSFYSLYHGVLSSRALLLSIFIM